MTTAQLPSKRLTGVSSPDGSLTADFISTLRNGYRMDAADLARHNAVANNEIKSLALNRSSIRGDDGHFSHRIRTKGITNQKKSGRCWMFAGLNVLRPQVIRDHGMEEFEFSTAYLQFWDKMEKSNLYLESVIELRDVDFLNRDWEVVHKWMIEDGGWWNYLVGLIGKYGVMPLSAMPETHASTHTATLNLILGRLLRSRAVRMLDGYVDGGGVEGMRAAKDEALAEIYRLLVIHFGEPPQEFEWRYPLRKNGESENADETEFRNPENRRLSTPERHTPQSFCRKFVGAALSEFVCLYNDPLNEMNRHYCFDRARNIVGSDCMNFVNIEACAMKSIARTSILANEPLWFAVNMAADQSEELGLMKHRLYDYETLFGIDMGISKANRTRFHGGASGHAMALMGVDISADGSPRKWLVENSWGDEKGEKGRWTLHDDWFDEHVYTIIVHRRHVPAEILKQFDEEALMLPAWYPGGMGVHFAPRPE